MQDEELLKILRRCRKGGCQGWPVMSLRRNLAVTLALMKVCGFSLLETAELAERKHGAMFALLNRNRDQLMEECQDFIQTVLKQLNVFGFRESY